jgi:hypothetical protein
MTEDARLAAFLADHPRAVVDLDSAPPTAHVGGMPVVAATADDLLDKLGMICQPPAAT